MTTHQRHRTQSDRPAELPAPEERTWEQCVWQVTDAGVLAITMNRAEHLNAINFPTIRELITLLRDVATRPEVRVVTIRGAGTRAFCSGDNIGGMAAEPAFDNPHTGHIQLITIIRELRKPVVALIYGYALGAGFELAIACDFRLAADNLEMGDHRVTRSIGMVGGVSWFLPRLIGRARAAEVMLTGYHVKAQEALDWGLVTRVWPMDEFEEQAAEYVSMLAKLPTIALSAFKDALDYGEMHGLRDALHNEGVASRRMRGTEDAEEGRHSFIERREPVFQGR